MLHTIGPCHYLCYADLFRRSQWLRLMATKEGLNPKLDAAFRQIALRFPPQRESGIRKPLGLGAYIDDTPIESFLRNLSDQIDALEANLFALIEPLARQAASQNASQSLFDLAGLWGRDLGHDVLLSEVFPKPAQGSLSGLRDALVSILAGGEWPQRRYLFRRQLVNELSYELLACPHRRHLGLSREAQDFFCQIESAIYRGFFEALAPEASYRRSTLEDYCVDFVSL